MPGQRSRVGDDQAESHSGQSEREPSAAIALPPVSNAEFSRLLQRGDGLDRVAAVLRASGGLIQRDPVAPPAPQKLVDRAPQLIRGDVTDVIQAATRGGDWPEFAKTLVESVRKDVASEATQEQLHEVSRRANALAEVTVASDAGVEYTIPTALSALEQLHAKGAQVDGLTLSFGLQFVTKLLGRDATAYLVGSFRDPIQTDEEPPPEIERWVGTAVDALSSGDTLVGLELEGTIDRLIDLRGQFAASHDRAARKDLGAAIGETARRALLLDSMLREARRTRKDEDKPLFASVAAVLPKIKAAAETSQGSEDKGLSALGGGVELLGETRVDVEPVTGETLGQTAVNPEEAFPKAVDRADQQFMSELAGRIENQAAQVRELHDKVVPKNYELSDFIAAFRRWHAFFSGRQEHYDPVVKLAFEFMDTFYTQLGIDTNDPGISIQQGVGRALLMPSIVQAMRGGVVANPTKDFEHQLDALKTKRTTTGASGSATAPSYGYAELYAGTPGGTSFGAEVASRKSLASSHEGSTAAAVSIVAKLPPDEQPAAAAKLGLAPDAGAPIAGARPSTPQEGWSYLIDVYDFSDFTSWLDPKIVEREQKTVPQEVVDYMLARKQQQATLGQAHKPTTAAGVAIGGPGVRHPLPRQNESGLETGTGMAAEMYVEGEEEGGLDPTAASLRKTIAAAQEQSAALGDLAGELSRYLDAYFAQRQTAVARVGAILAIAQVEYDVAATFEAFTDANKFKAMLEEAIAISAGLALLSSLGPLGRLASMAIGAYLRSKGVSNITAMISIGAFLKQAADASDFAEARGWALVARGVAQDLANVMQNVATAPATHAVGELFNKRPSTDREMAEGLRPAMKDPVMREAMMHEINQRLEELAAKPDDPAAQSERAKLIGFRDTLLGKPTTEAQAINEPLKEPKPEDRGAEIFDKPRQRSGRDLAALHGALGDLSGKVPIVENPALHGSTVHIRYGEDGGVRLEIGPEAEPRHIEYHREAVRELRRYEGVFGRIRIVASKVLDALRLSPGYGTKGFEARQEVRKLRAIEKDLQQREAAISKSLEQIGEHPEHADRELTKIRRELEQAQAQLAEHEKFIDDYSKGSGIVAATDPARPPAGSPQGWPVDAVNPRKDRRGRWTGMPDVVPEGRVLQFPGGERVWRNPGTGEIIVESSLGPAPGRRGYERQFPRRGEYDADYQEAMYELAHAQGQGTGFESPYAILLAPSEVNQRFQRWGVEEYLYRLRDQAPPGTEFHLVTSSEARPRTREMASITYRIDVSQGGQRRPLFAFKIVVEGDRTDPHVYIEGDSVWMSGEKDMQRLLRLVDMKDVHERFRQADLAARVRQP